MKWNMLNFKYKPNSTIKGFRRKTMLETYLSTHHNDGKNIYVNKVLE